MPRRKLISQSSKNHGAKPRDSPKARDWFVPFPHLAKAEISKERFDEYIRLIRITDVKTLSRNGEQISFRSWSGWYGIDPTSSQSKDYVFAAEQPSPLYDSLDQPEKLPLDPSSPSAYKRINANWYLEYTVTD